MRKGLLFAAFLLLSGSIAQGRMDSAPPNADDEYFKLIERPGEVEALAFFGCKRVTGKYLNLFPNLTTLIADSSGLTDENLAKVSKVETLSINNCPQIKGASLGRLSNLKTLYINSNTGLSLEIIERLEQQGVVIRREEYKEIL